MKKTLAAAFAAALAVWLFDGAVSYRSLQTLSENDRRVTHSHEVLAQLTEVLSTVQDVETGQRGYLLTGRDEYLSPYRQALTRIEEVLDRLQALVADNPRQQVRIALLRREIRDKLDLIAETITLRARPGTGFEDALRVVRSDRGRKKMDEIRELIAGMTGEEKALLVERSGESQASAQAAFAALPVVSAIGVVLLGLLTGLG